MEEERLGMSAGSYGSTSNVLRQAKKKEVRCLHLRYTYKNHTVSTTPFSTAREGPTKHSNTRLKGKQQAVTTIWFCG